MISGDQELTSNKAVLGKYIPVPDCANSMNVVLKKNLFGANTLLASHKIFYKDKIL